ncbi:MAG: putative DNA binding domain-containing protein [Candidatus Yanofskybacteria bacterium]|nr:putative DNA binding domain-containing protein [Candidatus Yanofskybacteria bacterium]
MPERIIKKSPVVIVKNFLILQASAFIAYTIAAYLGYYSQIYRSLFFSKIISFQVAQAVFVFGLETLIIFYIFFRWYKEYWQIQPYQIVHGRGLLFRRRETIPLNQISSVSYSQGPLGKLVKYGTIEIKTSQSEKYFSFKDLPEPQSIADLIIKFKQASDFTNKPSRHDLDLNQLLKDGETENLELKSTFRWDLRAQKINRQLEKSVMKTIAAFLNSQGGQIILGIDDNKKPTGMEADYATLGKPNSDGFENHFSHIFHNMIGSEFRHLVKLNWLKLEGKDCCVVSVTPSLKPAFLRTDDSEEFCIRTGNGTTALKFSEASSYISSHFKNSLV